MERKLILKAQPFALMPKLHNINERDMLDLGLKELNKFSLPEEIVGKKVIIKRRIHQYDEELFNLIDHSRDFLREFLFWVDDTKTLDNVKNVTDIFNNNWNEQKSFEYVFLDSRTGKMVGAGGIHTISYMHHWAEFGYYLDKSATGNGYITEVVNLLTNTLFEHGIHRVVIECDKQNTASENVAKRCGFEYEGCQKQARLAYGKYRDELLYAKINPNF